MDVQPQRPRRCTAVQAEAEGASLQQMLTEPVNVLSSKRRVCPKPLGQQISDQLTQLQDKIGSAWSDAEKNNKDYWSQKNASAASSSPFKTAQNAPSNSVGKSSAQSSTLPLDSGAPSSSVPTDPQPSLKGIAPSQSTPKASAADVAVSTPDTPPNASSQFPGTKAPDLPSSASANPPPQGNAPLPSTADVPDTQALPEPPVGNMPPGNAPERVPGNMPGGPQGNFPGNAPGNMPTDGNPPGGGSGFPGNMPGGGFRFPGNNPDPSGAMPQPPPGNMPGNSFAGGKLPGNMPGDMPAPKGGFPGSMPDGAPMQPFVDDGAAKGWDWTRLAPGNVPPETVLPDLTSPPKGPQIFGRQFFPGNLPPEPPSYAPPPPGNIAPQGQSPASSVPDYVLRPGNVFPEPLQPRASFPPAGPPGAPPPGNYPGALIITLLQCDMF